MEGNVRILKHLILKIVLLTNEHLPIFYINHIQHETWIILQAFNFTVRCQQHSTAAAAAKTKEFDHREEVALIIFCCYCSFRSCLLGSKFRLYLLFTLLVALQKSLGCSFLSPQRMFLSLQYPPGITAKLKYFPSITVPFLSLLTPRSFRMAGLEKSLEWAGIKPRTSQLCLTQDHYRHGPRMDYSYLLFRIE